MATGIYKITCVPTGEFYIGLANDIASRWKTHRYELAKGEHCNKKLMALFNQHGSSAFQFEIIHECSGLELALWEAHFMCVLKPTLNATPPHPSVLKIIEAWGTDTAEAMVRSLAYFRERKLAKHRKCERCEATYKKKSDRFCPKCAVEVRRQMRESGYLVSPHDYWGYAKP